MVKYSVNTEIRKIIIFVLAVISVFVSLLAMTYISPYVMTSTAFGCFGFLYWLFDRFLWKIKPIIGLIGIPNINGNWEGTITRKDFRENITEAELPVTLTITQTWTSISLVLENTNIESVSGPTRSFSMVVGMDIQNSKAIIIRDIFSFDKAQGMSELRLSFEKEQAFLKGSYMSNVFRVGYIDLQRIS